MTRFATKFTALALALALAVAASLAHASTTDAEDVFVSRYATDVPLARYEQGELGVVLPSYARVYLYPAWRAIVLGRDGLAAHPARPGGLQAAVGAWLDGWSGSAPTAGPGWSEVRARHLAQPAAPRSPWRGEPWSYTYLNCPDAAFDFAATTLTALEKRADAQPQRLREWAQAQDAVFDFCDWDPKAKPAPGRAARAAPVRPQPLAAGEPPYWRQLRDYQIASSYFYDEGYEEARRRFEQIGATPGHPMQAWGAYLALRAALRATSFEKSQHDAQPPKDPAETAAREAWAAAQLAALQARAQRILADRQLAPVHEPTRATIRAAQARLTPVERLHALSVLLDDPKRDPQQDSVLGDWRRLAAEQITYVASPRVDEAALRRRHAWFDWMRTLQRCVFDTGESSAKEACPAERAHALGRWQAATGPEKRAWLLAALTLAESLTPALEAEALTVQASAPEYLSVRYQLARLKRLAGTPARAREIAQAALDSRELAQARSDSARFLLQQERFASANTRDDAAGYLQRQAKWKRDTDTGEQKAAVAPPTLASDGLRWLNTRLPLADLMAIGADTRLAPHVRAGIVVAAWLRADLLGRSAQALEAANAAQAFAGVRDAAAAYLAAPPAERRHVLLVAALKQQLSPNVRPSLELTQPAPATPASPDDEPLASMWCGIGSQAPAEADPWETVVEQVPPAPDLATAPAARDAEMAALGKLRTATGFLGEHVMARARTHPGDPELPRLLHVVVKSTKGGCVDPDNRRLSRAAWQLLHSRYKASPWAARTPYWY